jgi:hypothetical protein
LWGWTVDNFQLSEIVLKGRTGPGGSRRVGQLRKLRVSRPQASLCAGACVCVCARTTAAGLACLHRAHPHLTGDPCTQAGPGAPPRWASRPGEPFAGLPKCFEGAGQKEVSCAGQHAPARAARVVRGGVTRMGLLRVPSHREARSLLYENRCPAMDSCGVMGMFWGLSAGALTAHRHS